jgi:hypothetical protein
VQALDLGDHVPDCPRTHGPRAVERVVDVFEVRADRVGGGRRQTEFVVQIVEQNPEPPDPHAAGALVLEGSDAADDDQLALAVEQRRLDVEEIGLHLLSFLSLAAGSVFTDGGSRVCGQ